MHPGSPSVARCDSCGRTLCLSCAIPVRGRTFGTECLVVALGPEAPQEAAEPAPPGRTFDRLVGAGFALAVGASALPWSRFGVGSDAFGAWGRDARWSLLEAAAATVGLLVWVVARRLPPSPRLDAIAAVLAALALEGSLLAIVRPPSFTRTWIGPWVGVVGCALALWAAIGSLRQARRTAGRGSGPSI
jgi:hypothetical protein